jgi:hypothetical protein
MTSRLELTICAACGRQYSDRAEGARCDADDRRVVFVSEYAKADRDSMLGRVVGGKFPLLGILGSGGMGAVYRGVQELVGRPVGVKVMKPQNGHPERELAERFLREARAMGQINHPAVVTLYDFGEEPDGTLYMVMVLPISEIRGESIVAQASALPRASRRGGGDDAQKSHGTRGSEGWIGRGRGGRRALL